MSLVQRLFLEGTKKLIEEHDKEEETKVGILRAGNTGIAERLADGSIIVSGKCHRLTMLRFLGINPEEEDHNKELMFAGGRGNEDLWIDVLKKSGWKGKILREEEIPIAWKLPDGTAVTGRPDIVLQDEDGKNVVGIELKLVSSLWTARDVLNGKPKAMHIMQAGHYSWQMGIPFELWYTSRANYAVPDWAGKLFPKAGEKNSEFLNFDAKKGNLKSTIPFRIGFELHWTSDGTLQYKEIGTTDIYQTIVTKERIKDYFKLVKEMLDKKELGSRVQNLELDGSKGSFNICDYCPLQKTCIEFESKGFDSWLSEVKRLSERK